MLGFDGEYPAGHSKARFWRFLVKNRKKSAVKIPYKNLSCLNSWVCLQPFSQTCSWLMIWFQQKILVNAMAIWKSWYLHLIISISIKKSMVEPFRRTYDGFPVSFPKSCLQELFCRKLVSEEPHSKPYLRGFRNFKNTEGWRL